MGEEIVYHYYVEMQYLAIFHMKYTRYIQNKGILNRNHDYAMLRSY